MHLRQHRPFEVVEYNPEWVAEFELRRKILEKILGDSIIDIYHIGSTAIPGMPAKPQIDILVVTRDLGAVRMKRDQMAAEGFHARGDYTGIGEEYFTQDSPDGRRMTSVHVLPQGHKEIEEQIAFRDYLMANAEDRNLYAEAKKRLFAEHHDNYSAYGSGKEKVIEDIRQRAKEWQRQNYPSHP